LEAAVEDVLDVADEAEPAAFAAGELVAFATGEELETFTPATGTVVFEAAAPVSETVN